MKRFLATILTILIYSTMLMPLAFADNEYFPDFKVGTFLRAGDCAEGADSEECKKKSQQMDYFKGDSDISPATQILLKAIDMLVTIIGAIIVIVLIIGGLMLATAHGNEQQIQKGKDIFKYSIAALAVTFLAFVIVSFVQSLLT